jgi:hypothetical protein
MLTKAHLSDSHGGQFEKGMLMDFADRAMRRLIAVEKGLIKEVRTKNTHTQIQSNRDRIANKQKKIEQENNDFRGRLLNWRYENVESNRSYLKKEEMDKAIIYATNCKARSLDNKRKDLFAYGIIVENRGEYRILEALEPEPENNGKEPRIAIATTKPIESIKATDDMGRISEPPTSEG